MFFRRGFINAHSPTLRKHKLCAPFLLLPCIQGLFVPRTFIGGCFLSKQMCLLWTAFQLFLRAIILKPCCKKPAVCRKTDLSTAWPTMTMQWPTFLLLLFLLFPLRAWPSLSKRGRFWEYMDYCLQRWRPKRSRPCAFRITLRRWQTPYRSKDV